MKVVLISIEGCSSIFFPIMQEMLAEKGHECLYIHVPFPGLGNISDEELDKVILELEPLCKDADLIGTSCMTNTYVGFTKLATKLKSFGVPLIVGGVHPTVRPEECWDYVDYVCVGEGEEPLMELVDRMDKKKSTDKIKNLYVKKKQKVIKNKLGEIVKDVNTLPVPKFDYEKTYFYHNGKIKSLAENKELIKKEYGKYYFIITSRGCPYRCKYCLNDCLIQIKPEYAIIRKRNKEHIMEELRRAKKVLPKGTMVGFVDDDFCTRSLEDLGGICEAYKKEIGIPFFCASTPTSMNKEKIEMLADAGLIRLEIGVQSIDDYVNKEIYGRYIGRKQVEETVKILEKYRHKMTICYDFILDNPWETDKTRLESLDFILSLKKPVNFFLFSLTLYPGTGLLDKAKKEGIIKDEFKEVYTKNHMLLENSVVNTLFVLYINYHLPKNIVKLLMKTRNFVPINKALGKSTYPLFRFSNYLTGLRDSINVGDKELRNYYLKAPFKNPLRIFR